MYILESNRRASPISLPQYNTFPSIISRFAFLSFCPSFPPIVTVRGLRIAVDSYSGVLGEAPVEVELIKIEFDVH